MSKFTIFCCKKMTVADQEWSFGDFYNRWLGHLNVMLLPRLRQVLPFFSSSPELVSMDVEAVHQHFISYFDALDEAIIVDVCQCLNPEWRNSLEKPFLWLGDLHPYLFTNLLRSFLVDHHNENNNNDEDAFQEEKITPNEINNVASVTLKEFLDGTWTMKRPWKCPSKELTMMVDQIECGLRLMVPALTIRAQEAQWKLVRRVSAQWGDNKAMKRAVQDGVVTELEELVAVVKDANRMRRGILADVMSVANLYQRATFLEALAQFLIGFCDQKLLKVFHECDKPINCS